jgi:hypothetical protein
MLINFCSCLACVRSHLRVHATVAWPRLAMVGSVADLAGCWPHNVLGSAAVAPRGRAELLDYGRMADASQLLARPAVGHVAATVAAI